MGNDVEQYAAPDTTGIAAAIGGLRELAKLASRSADVLGDTLIHAIEGCTHALLEGGKLLVCGNGGSAADAQHFVAEMVGRFKKHRPGLAAICLNTDTAILTAVANDFGYAQVFGRQIEAIGEPQDMLIGISTSGKSLNVGYAVSVAAAMGMPYILLTGDMDKKDTWALAHLAVPSRNTQRVQEIHTAVLHALAKGIEERLYGGGSDQS